MTLTKHEFKTKFGLQIERTVERERREGEKKRKRRRRRRKKKRSQAKRYGTTKFEYGSLVCMIIILPKPRVLLGFHPIPIIMESKVDKTLNNTRKV